MSEFHTLMDLKNSVLPGDSALADVAEVLTEENEALNDIPWVRGNQLTGDIHFRRAAMPTAQVRMINQGIKASTSKSTAHVDTCVEINTRSIVDMSELKLAPNAAKYLLNMSKPHLAVLGQDVITQIFYGADAAGILGFAARYGKLNGDNKRQIVDFGGTGGELASIFIIKWDTDEVTGIYPKNVTAGLDMIALPNQFVADKDGNDFLAHVTDYKWMAGLKVRDHRYAARLCNIPLDVIRTDKEALQKVFDDLIIAKNRIRQVSQGRVVMYVSPDMYSMLEIAAFNKTNMALGYRDVTGDTRILTFSGIPIRSNDCQLKAETQVV